MIPVMLIAIGVADGIHIYSHMRIYKSENPDTSISQLLKDSYRELWRPVVMTSVTTAIGFISLLTSEVYPIKYFGLFTAFGVMSAMVLSLVLLPAGITLFGFPKTKVKVVKENDEKKTFLSSLSYKVIENKYAIVISTVIILIISGYGITKVWIDSSFLKNFEEDSDIVKVDNFVNQHFGGTSTLNIILKGNKKDIFKEPKVLNLVNDLQKAASEDKMIGSSFALTDYMKRMNMVMHGDDRKYNTIPETKNAVAQYLLLYEMSGDPENLTKTVDYEYQNMNLVFQLKSDSSKTIKAAIKIIDKFRDDFKKLGIEIKYAGSGYKALVFTELILEGQIKSLVMSLIIVLILLTFIFKSLLIGMIGSVPIIITAAINFGIMGLLNIPLSSTTALLSSISVGIGIDYAIHFIERYKLYSAESNDKLETASKTMEHSGKAIIFNAFVVISGFLVLTVSVFPPNRELGALVSLNMFTSFLGTITIMLLLLFKSNVYFKDRANH
jgi:predicted RND superfamily exporter protein